MFGKRGVTNQAAGARSAVMTFWVEGFGWVDAKVGESV